MKAVKSLEPTKTAKETGARVSNETVYMGLRDVSASPQSERRYTRATWSFDAMPDVEALAREQGVPSNAKFEDLLGDFWPEDRGVEDFFEARKRWRREGRNPNG